MSCDSQHTNACKFSDGPGTYYCWHGAKGMQHTLTNKRAYVSQVLTGKLDLVEKWSVSNEFTSSYLGAKRKLRIVYWIPENVPKHMFLHLLCVN